MDTRIATLRAELARLNDLYYNQGQSDVSDEVYDSLKQELKALEGETDDPLSPLNQIGAPPGGSFDKVKHLSPMLSLMNVYNEEELIDWCVGLDSPIYAALEYKLDGASLNVRYTNGKLVCAVTRGDGYVGDDITDNAVFFEGIPADIGPIPGDIEFRGECIIPHAQFKKACERREAQGKKPYANARNMVAGLMRRKEGESLLGMGIRFIAYDAVIYGDGMSRSVSLADVDDSVLQAFYKVDALWTGLSTSIDQIMETVNRVAEERHSLEYDIDGLVLKAINGTVRSSLGQRSTSPRWAVAYKFEAQSTTSILERVEVQVGRTGVLTPVAKIRPVKLCGVTISSVTLHNFEEVKRLDLRIGDTVVVSRRGDVIPKIESVITSLRTDEHGIIQVPTTCPCCDSPVESRGEGGELFCTNDESCAAQVVNRMSYFVSRAGIDVKNLGPAAVEALIEAGSLGSYSSLFHLSEEDFYLAGISTNMAEKILTNINRCRVLPFYKVLRAVGIPEVGDSTARALASQFHNFEALGQAILLELQEVDDVGPTVAQSIVNAFLTNGYDLLALDKILTYTDEVVKKAEHQDLTGLTVVVSGSSFDGKSRKEMEDEVISRGGKLTKSVSKNTDIVFLGVGHGPDKAKTAKELGFTEVGAMLVNPKTLNKAINFHSKLVVMPVSDMTKPQGEANEQ